MLSISDWISYLSGERHSNVGIIVGFSAFILAAFAIIMSVTNNTLISTIPLALVAIALVIFYFRTIGPYGRRAKLAGKLLDNIMNGKERDLLIIEKEWGKVIDSGKKK